MIAWEKDLQSNWELEDWYENYSQSVKDIYNTSLIESNIKVFTRWYLVPTRLAATFPSTSPLCFRGCQGLSSMILIWWECPR